MKALDVRVIERIHDTMYSMYRVGAIDWIEERYLDERKDLCDRLDEAICKFRLELSSEHELRRIASQYLRKHMSWVLEFRQSQKRLAS